MKFTVVTGPWNVKFVVPSDWPTLSVVSVISKSVPEGCLPLGDPVPLWLQTVLPSRTDCIFESSSHHAVMCLIVMGIGPVFFTIIPLSCLLPLLRVPVVEVRSNAMKCAMPRSWSVSRRRVTIVEEACAPAAVLVIFLVRRSKEDIVTVRVNPFCVSDVPTNAHVLVLKAMPCVPLVNKLKS